MSKKYSVNEIVKKIKSIIKNNSPKEAIIKISKLVSLEDNSKLGLEKAYKIYCIYVDYANEYDVEKYRYNIQEWNKIRLNNLRLAEKAYNNLR